MATPERNVKLAEEAGCVGAQMSCHDGCVEASHTDEAMVRGCRYLASRMRCDEACIIEYGEAWVGVGMEVVVVEGEGDT